MAENRMLTLGGKQIHRQIYPVDFAWVFDPFAGSSTTGIAANLCGRRYCGIEQEEEFCTLSKARREELEDVAVRRNLHNHIADLKVIDSFSEDEMPSILRDEYISEYGKLPFD